MEWQGRMTNPRVVIQDQIKTIDGDFAISTSGGIDSSSIVASALDLGLVPKIVSFTLENRLSTDFKAARKLAMYFGLPFIPVFLPTDHDVILDDVRWIVKAGARKKTAIECLYPFLYVLRQLRAEGIGNLVTGSAADGHFALSKKAMIHFKEPKSLFQEFRTNYFKNPDAAQVATLTRIGKTYDVKVMAPYFHDEMFKLFVDKSWSELNKPRQKEAIRKHFPELDIFNIKIHINLQLGDSGIADQVGAAVIAKIAPYAKSPITAYNILAKQA
jgi:asparagine synthetase B (glutamine-hydrolysing)